MPILYLVSNEVKKHIFTIQSTVLPYVHARLCTGILIRHLPARHQPLLLTKYASWLEFQRPRALSTSRKQ